MIKIIVFCCLILGLFSFNSKVEEEQHQHIVLRAIGHELLVQSGETGTRVLPVRQLGDNIFEISFEKEFSFVTDTLINTIDRIFKKEGITGAYQVLATQCDSEQVTYAYEVSSETEFLIPCTNVKNPKACYKIRLTFIEEDKSSNAWIPLFILPFIGLLVYLFARKKKKNETEAKEELIHDGDTLSLNNETIQLSDQESKLYGFLKAANGEVVERDFLLHEIWEKDGTIVTTRSLDVLVSKLRKKIALNPSLKISNVHGKGYKLTSK